MSAPARTGRKRSGTAPAGGDARTELLLALGSLGALTAEALGGLLGASVSSARGRLAATERAGLTRSWRLLTDAPALHTATAAGLRAAGTTGLSPVRIGPGSARHAIATATAAAGLAGAYPDAQMLGEPAIRRLERERRRPLATLAGPHGGGLLRTGGGEGSAVANHRPDLLLMPSGRPAPAGPVAIEVELTVKGPERLAAICRAWARSREVSGTIYLAAPTVLGPLERAIAAAGAEQRVVALELDAFGSAIAGAA